MDFNLRFVQGADMKDAGVAVLGIHASPTEEFGMTQVVFPSQGWVECCITQKEALLNLSSRTYQVLAVDK